MRLLKTINLEGIEGKEYNSYRVREAGRAVLFDNKNSIALLHVKKHGYNKLPGGGVEEGENIEEALKRECLEETGCNIEITKEVGSIIEYRKEFQMKQVSTCYIAKVAGNKGKSEFTKKETLEEFELIWVNLDEIDEILAMSLPTNYEGRFIKVRDKIFIREAMKLL